MFPAALKITGITAGRAIRTFSSPFSTQSKDLFLGGAISIFLKALKEGLKRPRRVHVPVKPFLMANLNAVWAHYFSAWSFGHEEQTPSPSFRHLRVLSLTFVILSDASFFPGVIFSPQVPFSLLPPSLPTVSSYSGGSVVQTQTSSALETLILCSKPERFLPCLADRIPPCTTNLTFISSVTVWWLWLFVPLRLSCCLAGLSPSLLLLLFLPSECCLGFTEWNYKLQIILKTDTVSGAVLEHPSTHLNCILITTTWSEMVSKSLLPSICIRFYALLLLLFFLLSLLSW